MKVLTFKELYFKLPDDFDGDLTDALQEWVNYRKSKDKKEISFEHRKKFPDKATDWEIFLEMIKKGYREHGKIGFWESDEKKKGWKDIPYDKE